MLPKVIKNSTNDITNLLYCLKQNQYQYPTVSLSVFVLILIINTIRIKKANLFRASVKFDLDRTKEIFSVP